MTQRTIFSFFTAAIITLLFVGCANDSSTQFEKDFNFDWKFSLMDSLEVAYDTDFDDSNWREVRLPHDWSIEFPFDSIKGIGSTAYLLGGRGWYRKHFDMPLHKNEVVSILFDGVYNHSEIWVNAKKVGEQKSGYAPFKFDITKYLNPNGKDNVIAVKVDHSRYADSRWYSGSGINRNVKRCVCARNKCSVAFHVQIARCCHCGVDASFNLKPCICRRGKGVHGAVNRDRGHWPRRGIV